MSSELERRLAMLEREKATLLKRARELPVFQRNEAYRKINIIDDEIARILTPNAV